MRVSSGQTDAGVGVADLRPRTRATEPHCKDCIYYLPALHIRLSEWHAPEGAPASCATRVASLLLEYYRGFKVTMYQ